MRAGIEMLSEIPPEKRQEFIGGLVYISLVLILVIAFVGVNVSQGVLST